MTGDRWQKLQDIFHSASDLGLEGRAAYLDEVCSGDPELREEVEALLASSAGAERLEDDLRRAASDAFAGARLIGTRVGPYRLMREIGEGGMARVYLAQRDDDQFQRRVAVKLAFSALSPQALLRFRSERQILAGLDHPNIARLLDGGATDDDVPYLVLEYVEGERIDHYCDSREMSVPERIRVFRLVCEAVRYAHQNLVVHRDLKPSNILVTPEGIPKLLDFGIAKMLRPELLAHAPALTTALHRPMTPEYASPEQVRGEPVTTGSDVYSLGVVLYELLTGCLPLRFEGTGLAAIERTLTDVEPGRPSAVTLRVSGPSDGKTPEERARDRKTTPGKLCRTLGGDLDNIVLMALRKAPARRYISVFQFSDDLRRYLEGHVVLARRDTVRYRVRKFVRRNRWGVGAAATILVLLVGWAANRAQLAQALVEERDDALQQAETARRMATFLEDVLRSADPSTKGDTPITVRDILDRASSRVDSELVATPAIQAELFHTLGRIYRHLGLLAHADSLLERALAIRLRVAGERTLETAQSLLELGEIRREQSRYAEAESLTRRALAVRERLLRPDHPDIAESLDELGSVLRDEGRYAEAESTLRHALALREGYDHDGVPTAATLSSLAQALDDEGRPVEAEPLVRRSADIMRRRLGRSPETARVLGRLGSVLRHEGKFAEAGAAIHEALEIDRKVLGADHPALALDLDNLANLLRDRGELRAAETRYRESMRIYEDRLGNDPPALAAVRSDLAQMLIQEGRLGEADRLLRMSLATLQRLGDDGPLVLQLREGLARVALARGSPAEAESLFRQTLDARRRSGQGAYLPTSATLVGLGHALLARGDAVGAEPMLREALHLRTRLLPPGHRQIAEVRAALDLCRAARGRPP